MTQAMTTEDVLHFMTGILGEERTAQTRLQVARREYSEAEFDHTVKDHILFFWGPRMLKAVARNKKSITNLWAFGCKETSLNYQLALGRVLSKWFDVEVNRAHDWLGRKYLVVSWK